MKEKTTDIIKSYINNLISTDVIKGFYSSAVTKKIKEADEEIVIAVLQQYVDAGVLEKTYRVGCLHCFRELFFTRSKEELNEKMKRCNYCRCGKELDVSDIYTNVYYKINRK